MQSQRGAPVFPKPAEIFLSAFGMVPWYSFQKGRLVLPRVFKAYAATLTVAITVMSVLGLFVRLQHTLHPDNILLVTMDILCEVVRVISFVATMWSLSDGKLWEEVYSGIGNIVSATNSAFPNTNIILVIGNASIFILFVVDFAEDSTTIIYYFILPYIFRFLSFLLAYLIFHVILTLKYQYVGVRKLLKFTPDEVLSGSVFPRVRKIKKLYLDMNDLIRSFNTLFGWTILLQILHLIMQIQYFLVIIISDHLRWDNNRYKIEMNVCFKNALYLLQILVWLTAIIFCCDSVVRETDELLTNCYRLEQTLPLLSKEIEELNSLKNLIKNKSPKLTAAGFFEIRRSTLLSLLATTTTYFIVALQFNSL